MTKNQLCARKTVLTAFDQIHEYPYRSYQIMNITISTHHCGISHGRPISWLVSVTNIMAGLAWRSLQERRLESRLCMLYKTIKGTSACNILAYIHPHSTSLRASHDQQYRVPHTTNPIDAYTYSFFPRTIRIWNILPAALVHASTIEGFKNGLHKEFLSGNMYVISSRGQYDRPGLGSSASLSVVGPVY